MRLKCFTAKASILKDVQILLVDNDRDTRDMYNVLFKDYGATLIAAKSIKEASEMLNWLLPNILVCEIKFSGESVYPLLRQLRFMKTAYGRHIPILVTSASPTNSFDQIQGVEVEGYLLKPIEPEHLVLKIWSLLLANKNLSSTYGLESTIEPESEQDFAQLVANT